MLKADKLYYLSIMAAGVALRVPGLIGFPVWYDEAFTRAVSGLDLPRLVAATAGDVHPPLWYLITGLFMGGPAWAVRVPSLIAWALAAVVFFFILDALDLPRPVRWIAAAVMVFAPMQIWYSVEARAYAALELAVLVGFWSAMRPGKRAAALAVSFAALLWLHNWGLFYCATIGLYALYKAGRTWPRVVLAGAVGLLSWTPWAGVLFSQMGDIGGAYWITVERLAPGLVIYTIIQQFIGPSLATLPGMCAILAALILGIYTARNKYRDILYFGFMPVLLGLVVSLIWNPVILYRAMIGIAPFLYILAALPAAALGQLAPGPRLRWAILAAILFVPVAVYGAGSFLIHGPGLKTDDSDLIIDYIRDQARPGDVIIHSLDGSAIMLYESGLDLPQYILIPCGRTPGELTQQTRDALGLRVVSLDQIEFTRAWVIWAVGPFSPACELDYLGAVLGPDPALIARDSDIVRLGVWVLNGH